MFIVYILMEFIWSMYIKIICMSLLKYNISILNVKIIFYIYLNSLKYYIYIQNNISFFIYSSRHHLYNIYIITQQKL